MEEARFEREEGGEVPYLLIVKVRRREREGG